MPRLAAAAAVTAMTAQGEKQPTIARPAMAQADEDAPAHRAAGGAACSSASASASPSPHQHLPDEQPWTIPGLPARSGGVFCPHLPQTPRYLTVPSARARAVREPLAPPDPALVSRMRVQDAMRMQHPSTVLNRKVYDSIAGDPLREVRLRLSDDEDGRDGEGDEGDGDDEDDDGHHALDADARGGAGGSAAPMARAYHQHRAAARAGAGAVQLPSPASSTAPELRVEDSLDGAMSTTESTSRLSSPPLLKPYYTPRDEQDLTLLFESRFESGNLCRAIQVYDFEYDLVLRPDINTNRHVQWYYFRISNTRRGHSYKLNIINMMKTESLYEHGQRVLAFSERAYAEDRRGWYHTGANIAYYQNNIRCAPPWRTPAHHHHHRPCPCGRGGDR